mmetsp:Transcript_29212/g.54135  ORF Transcript_29212/g.54135 Transcript_29212/m.54135 type:complete len:294 (-) Transcript_29212:24-905(-)
MYLRDTVDDVEEVSLKRGSTNEATINIRLGKKFLGIGTLHTSTILNAHSLRNCFAHIVSHPLPDASVCLLRHFWSRCEPSSNSPDWLVGNSNIRPIFLTEKLRCRLKLLRTDIEGDTCLPFFLLLANGKHDLQSSIKCYLDLLGDKLAVFASHAKTLTTLGVTNNNPGDASINKLGCTDFTSVGSLLLIHTTVLGTDSDVITKSREADTDVNVRSANSDFSLLGDGASLIEHLDELLARRDSSVALPVATNEVRALALLRRLTRGRTLRPAAHVEVTDSVLDCLNNLSHLERG